MATVRQTVVTRQTTSSSGAPITITTETQRSAQSPEWDNTLDALLEDLQTSVSRPGSAAGGSISRSGSRGPGSINGPLSGASPGTVSSTRTFREVKEAERYPQHGIITKVRTVQQHGVSGEAGQPVPPTRDFNNVQYLMAANPTHIVAERAASPLNPEYQMGGTGGNLSEVAQQKTVTAYKTISYQYNTSDAQHPMPVSSGLLVDGVSAQPLPPPPVLSPTATPPPQRRHRTPSGSGGKVDVQLRQNLNELDNLLDDLNHAQQAAALRAQTASPTNMSHKSVSPGPPEVVRGTRGIDSSLLPSSYPQPTNVYYGREDPMDHSTPVNRHVTHTVRTYRYDTRYGGEDGPHDPNGPPHDGPPTGRQSLPRQIIQGTPPPPRDHYGTEPRHIQSTPTPPPPQVSTTVRTYTYGSPGAPPPQTPPSRVRGIPRQPHESPSPSRQQPRYPRDDVEDDDRDGPTDPLMPGSPRRTTTTTVRTYTYQLPGSPPNSGPNEPQQPIPAPPPPSEPLTYHVTPRQPQQVTELRPQPTPQTTVVTYKFTTSSGQPQPGIPEPLDRSPRPFPVDDTDGVPSSQQPPKRLDDLMASFTDTTNLEPQKHPEAHPVSPVRYTVEDKVASNPPVLEGNGVGPKPVAGGTRAAPSPDRPKTKNIAGPPVYYPPGVEMFAKKDEPVQARMKESESSSKGESKSGGGGAAVVPVCLPLCCAMPCVIM